MFNEIEFLKKTVRNVFKKNYKEITVIEKKSAFDLVTDIDMSIESNLIARIKETYPTDNILSEEINFETQLKGRTWTIDPIDGTINMVHGIKLYGIQISLVNDGEVSISYAYFPQFKDEYFAIKDYGSYLGGKRISVDSGVSFEDAIVSLGDYTHKNDRVAKQQHMAIGKLFPQIAKIRMFGSAALDLSLVASGSTAGCVVITKNLWDILPGYLLAKEAGAIITNLKGEPYNIGDDGIVAASNDAISNLIVKALNDYS